MNKEHNVEIFDLVVKNEQLPANIEDLIPLGFMGQRAVDFYRATVRRLDSLPMTQEQKGKTLRDGQDAGKMLLAIEGRIGELIKSLPRSKEFPGITEGGKKVAKGELAKAGLDLQQAHKARTIASHPIEVAEVIQEAEKNEDIPTKTAVLNKIKYKKEIALKEQRIKGAQETRQRPDINDALYSYINDLVMVNTGIEEILQNWEHVHIQLQRKYLCQIDALINMTEKYLGGEKESWKHLKQIV